jgi:hypothetical protein
VTRARPPYRRLALLSVPADRIDDLEQRIVLQPSIGFARRAPKERARNVRVPAFLYQVHDDVLTEPRHNTPLGRIFGVPASSRTDARMVRQAHELNLTRRTN